MNSSLRKNTIREIWHTKARFFSIMAIITLGVGFYVGISSASPSMKRSFADMYEKKSVMDIKLMSTYGFDADDVETVRKQEYINCVMPSYSSDIIIGIGNQSHVVRLMALPKAYKGNKMLNAVTLTDGHLPENENEIAIENKGLDYYGLKIGDTIHVREKAGDTDTADIIKQRELKIVGRVSSPLYVSIQRGNTNIGNGTVSFYAMADESLFAYERYTEIYATVVTSGAEKDILTDEYGDRIDYIASSLEKVGLEQVRVFQKDTVDKSWKELNDSQKEYDDRIADGEKKLFEAYDELNKAKIELSNGEAKYKKEIINGKKSLEQAQAELEQGKIDLEDGKTELQQQLEIARYQIDNAQKEYETQSERFYSVTKPQAEMTIRASQEIIEQSKIVISYIELMLSEMDIGKSERLRKQMDEHLKKLEENEEKINQAQAQLEDGERQIEEAKEKINQANLDYYEQKHAGERQLVEAQRKITAGEAELELAKKKFEKAKADGEKKLEDARRQYQEGQTEYDRSLAEFVSQKLSGKKKLDDARKMLEKLTDLKWYVFSREDLPGYADYIQDADRIKSVAEIFPLFFLLVAALVCLTTMMRMVDERRTEIGTFKALGYSSVAIAAKYLIYASIAASVGCVIGITVGINTLPRIVFFAYGIMYDIPDYHLTVPESSIVLGIGAAMICTAIVVLASCMTELRIFPATLMRPKAPKPGKRILLERIKPIWSRLNFSAKVTARNLFRYKVRFAMTVVGVAGCTALIVAGFGLKDAIGVIVEKQFEDISSFDAIMVLTDEHTAEDIVPILEDAKQDYRLENIMALAQIPIELPEGKLDGFYLDVPQNNGDFKKIYSLRERESGKKIDFDKCRAVITEKASKLFDISVGDDVTYIDGDRRYTVTIDAICENYIYNYIYISPDYYRSLYGKEPLYNTVISGIKENVSNMECDEFAEEWITRSDIISVQFTHNVVEKFSDMIANLNKVIVVMILCAAMLAFVVLYNLTNINISERMRELATLKVLGFYNRETSFYIYRESIIMTLAGTAIGLITGVFLAKFMVATVEVDSFMFGREIFYTTYIYAAVLTALFAFLVNWVMYFKMKKIDMIESLKSVE